VGSAAAAIVSSTTAGSAAMGDARMRFGGSRQPAMLSARSRGLAAAHNAMANTLGGLGGAGGVRSSSGSLQGMVDRSAAAQSATMQGRPVGPPGPAM
jgi:hypothetical protein